MNKNMTAKKFIRQNCPILTTPEIIQQNNLLLEFINWYNKQEGSKYIPNSTIGKFIQYSFHITKAHS